MGGAMTFGRWMGDVDDWVFDLSGVSVHDLPDCCFRAWYDDGVSAEAAAIRALQYAGFSGV